MLADVAASAAAFIYRQIRLTPDYFAGIRKIYRRPRKASQRAVQERSSKMKTLRIISATALSMALVALTSR